MNDFAHSSASGLAVPSIADAISAARVAQAQQILNSGADAAAYLHDELNAYAYDVLVPPGEPAERREELRCFALLGSTQTRAKPTLLRGRWIASIKFHLVTYHLSSYSTEREAAQAIDVGKNHNAAGRGEAAGGADQQVKKSAPAPALLAPDGSLPPPKKTPRPPQRRRRTRQRSRNSEGQGRIRHPPAR